MVDKETVQEGRFSYDDVFKMFNRLSKDEKSILSNLHIEDVYLLLNADGESFQTHINTVVSNIQLHIKYVHALLKLREMTFDVSGKDCDITNEYKNLSEKDKLKVALSLLNTETFQKDCSKILLNDFKKFIEIDPTIKALDQLLGIEKYLDYCIQSGIGCNHKYEV